MQALEDKSGPMIGGMRADPAESPVTEWDDLPLLSERKKVSDMGRERFARERLRQEREPVLLCF